MAPVTRSPSLEAMRQEAPPNRCIACDGPLPPRKNNRGRKRVLCRERDCARLYQQLYGMDRRARAEAQRLAWRALGCSSGRDYLMAHARTLKAMGDAFVQLALSLGAEPQSNQPRGQLEKTRRRRGAA